MPSSSFRPYRMARGVRVIGQDRVTRSKAGSNVFLRDGNVMPDSPLKKLRAKRIRIHRQLDKLEPLLAACHFKLAHVEAQIVDRASVII